MPMGALTVLRPHSKRAAASLLPAKRPIAVAGYVALPALDRISTSQFRKQHGGGQKGLERRRSDSSEDEMRSHRRRSTLCARLWVSSGTMTR